MPGIRISEPGPDSEVFIDNRKWGGSRYGLYSLFGPSFSTTFKSPVEQSVSYGPLGFSFDTGPVSTSAFVNSAGVDVNVFSPTTTVDVRIRASVRANDDTPLTLYRRPSQGGPILGTYAVSETATATYNLDTSGTVRFRFKAPRSLFYHYAYANGTQEGRIGNVPAYAASLSFYLQMDKPNGDPLTESVVFGSYTARFVGQAFNPN